jgi:hypothetical protein
MIKILMWFLNKNVLLTTNDKSLILFARLLWRIIRVTYLLASLTTDMFSNWLNGVDNAHKIRIQIGVSPYVGLSRSAETI